VKITLKEKFWGKSLKVDKVENLPGSTEGAYNPFALREEGCVSTLENLAVKFMNSTNSLDEISDADGEVYMSHGGKQSSPVVGVLVNDPDDFSNVRVIYYDAMSKELKKESQPASEKLKAFIWEKDEDGVLKREVTGAEVEVPKVVEIAMDGDRDDIIDFNNPADMEYLFWVNDDIDVISDEEEDDAESGTANCDDDVITCKRDLEDFTRLHIRIDNDVANMPGVSYWMKFENITSGSPSVNIFEAVDESSSYLSDASLAADQIQKQNLTQNGIGTAEIQINTQHIKNGEQISPFIIEGRHEGEGDLTFILKKDGREIYEKSFG